VVECAVFAAPHMREKAMAGIEKTIKKDEKAVLGW
jgi:hypothetical protein